MKQRNEDSDQSAHADIVVEAQTLRRLDSIQEDGESFDATLNRVLDDAVKNVPLRNILIYLQNEFEGAVNINVDLIPPCENPGMMVITVHTGEVGGREDVTFCEGEESRAVVESQAGERFCLPLDIIATSDGPKRETIETTPVYMADTILGLEPITVDEGLEQLRRKIGKPSEEVRDLISDY